MYIYAKQVYEVFDQKCTFKNPMGVRLIVKKYKWFANEHELETNSNEHLWWEPVLYAPEPYLI